MQDLDENNRMMQREFTGGGCGVGCGHTKLKPNLMDP